LSAHALFGVHRQAVAAHALFGVDDLAMRARNHGSYLGAAICRREPMAHRLGDEQPVGRGVTAPVMAFLPRPPAFDLDLVEAGQAGLQAAQRLLQDSWKVRPMAIASPTDFIAVVSRLAPGNFSKAKRGILVTT
jgi:hypothetical protein